MGIETYSTNANANVALMPEGQPASTVNNGVRAIQADLAAAYNDPGWCRPGAPAPEITRLSANSFRIAGVDVTSIYHQGRRVRIVGATTGTVYGRIDSSVYTGGNTDVTGTVSGAVQAEPLTVSIGTAATGLTTALPIARADWGGIIELLTSAEYQIGTNGGKAITAAIMTAGWQATTAPSADRYLLKFPLGIKVEVGMRVTPVTVTFLEEFVRLPMVICTPNHESQTTGAFATASALTTTTVGLNTWALDGTIFSRRVAYMAFGV